ncbi:MAG: hypothetical protein J6B68_07670 [Lachnospiraceae bacterium]|nr:hypothetical protein [Lachnospiraceae bacterium]
MSIIEIILIIVGIVIFALGYLLPARKKDMDEDVQLISEDEVRKLVAQEVEGAKEHIADIVDETITYAMEKTERSMERVTNEKIMAVNEYSDTVLEEINKNHKEVLFLYDMLNDKHENLKTTVSEATKTAEEVKQTVKDAEITAREAEETVKNAMDTVLDAVENVPEEVVEIHDASEYNEMLVDEVQQAMEDDQKAVQKPEEVKSENDNLIEEAQEKKEEEADEFIPIAPPRVEIIHNPDGDYDYVADTAEASQEIMELLQQEGPKEPKTTKKKTRTKKTAKTAERKDTKSKETEAKSVDAPAVDIQFANGKDNSRNSNERILELHKAGKSNMAIAKELGLGIGEVKLVIDLFEGL